MIFFFLKAVLIGDSFYLMDILSSKNSSLNGYLAKHVEPTDLTEWNLTQDQRISTYLQFGKQSPSLLERLTRGREKAVNSQIHVTESSQDCELQRGTCFPCLKSARMFISAPLTLSALLSLPSLQERTFQVKWSHIFSLTLHRNENKMGLFFQL